MDASYPPLAVVGVHIKFNDNYVRQVKSLSVFKVAEKMDINIVLLSIYQGINYAFFLSLLHTLGLKVVIMTIFGLGDVPTNKKFLKIIRKAVDIGLIILNVTQCSGGSVVMERYQTIIHRLEMVV